MICRPYRDESDYWAMRAFLREVQLARGGSVGSWHVVRWDYWRWHGIENVERQELTETVHLWETGERVVAAVTPEGSGEAFFHVHPAVASARLAGEMLDVAEATLRSDGRLRVWALDDDALLGAELVRRGYAPTGAVDHVRWRDLDGSTPGVDLAPGYAIRPLGGTEDFPGRGELSLRVFHPEPDGSTAMTADDYRWIQRCPLYRRDLDLVAVAPDGCLAGFCTVWFDDVTRTGVFEPVGVGPGHRRLGLARALMAEGLGRLQWLGAGRASVSSYGEPEGALYQSLGFEVEQRLVAWTSDVAVKRW